jgi:hypothetical protein
LLRGKQKKKRQIDGKAKVIKARKGGYGRRMLKRVDGKVESAPLD